MATIGSPKFIELDYVGYINVVHIVSIKLEYKYMKDYGFALILLRIRLSNRTTLFGVNRDEVSYSNHQDYGLDVENLEEALSSYDFMYEPYPLGRLEDYAEYIKKKL